MGMTSCRDGKLTWIFASMHVSSRYAEALLVVVVVVAAPL